jgi:hypothetical protein
VSYIFNFFVEILLILTYDLRSVDQSMNDSTLYVMVVGIEVQITTSMNILPVHFRGQFWTTLHNRNIQEWTGIISFNFHCEFYGRPKAVEMVKTLVYPCWSMWSYHECVVDISEIFIGIVVGCVESYFLKVLYEYITDHRR